MLVLSLLAAFAPAPVVSEDGRFTLACTHVSRRTGEVVTTADCAALDRDGQVRLHRARFADLVFDAETGLAQVRVRGWHYVARDGRSASVATFDNWAADFADGRALSPRGAKIGYVDQDLRLVIPARFDGAYPFAGGRARVCFGCTAASDGEHHWYVGGRWRCIDTAGREIAAAQGATSNPMPDRPCG